jgi:hypothetical protein
MALTTGNPLPFGLKDVQIIPFDAAAATEDTFTDDPADLVDFGYSRSFAFTINMTEVNQEGNDQVLATEYFDEKGTGTLEAAGMNINGLATLWGQVVTTTGVTPNKIAKLTRDVTVTKPFVGLQGRSRSSRGGAYVTTIMKAKAGGGPNMTQQYGQFGNAQIPISFVPNALGELITLAEYETYSDSDDGGGILPVAP